MTTAPHLLVSWPVPCREDRQARTPSFFATTPTVQVNQSLLAALESEAGRTGKNVRFCLHPDPAAELQEMIILQHAEQFFPPKRHPHKAKSFRVLSGELAILVFATDGHVAEVHRLIPGDAIACRISAGLFHADIPLTPRSIHFETTTGPFRAETDRELAPWGPPISDPVACRQYRAQLLAHLPRTP